MKAFALKAIKGLAIYCAKKYAAELLVMAAIEAMEKAAAKTNTQIDDHIVARIKQDQKEIINIISGKS